MAPSKKAVAKVPTKKEVKEKPAKVSAKFKSFSITAVIPVMSYGNIQPKIEVEAPTYEDARDFAMPLIAELFKEYGDAKPTFLGKITETVKEVVPVPMPTVSSPIDAPKPAPMPAQAPEAPVVVPTAPTTAPEAPESEFAARARKMIGLAMTEEAAEKIKAQVEASEKIPAHEKPALLDLVQDKLIKFSAESAF